MLAAGVLPISPSGKVLLNRRGLQQPEGGTWSYFGGRMSRLDGENPRNTASREFQEESCISENYSMSKLPFYIYKDNHISYYLYLALTPEFEPNIIPAHESCDWGWFDLENLPDALHYGVEKMLNETGSKLQNIIDRVKDKSEYEIESIIFVIEL